MEQSRPGKQRTGWTDLYPGYQDKMDEAYDTLLNQEDEDDAFEDEMDRLDELDAEDGDY